jgi:hypothetical protein
MEPPAMCRRLLRVALRYRHPRARDDDTGDWCDPDHVVGPTGGGPVNATSDSTAYLITYGVAITVHVVAALAGFGMLALSGLYGSWGRNLETAQTWTDLQQYFGRPNRAGRLLWVVPFAGGLALTLSHGAPALGQAWVIAATGCWAVTMVLAVRVVWPAERRIRPIVMTLDEAPLAAESRAEIAGLCRPIVRATAFCDVAFVVALALMILQPGR